MEKQLAEVIKFFGEIARIRKGLGSGKITWKWIEVYSAGEVYRLKIGDNDAGAMTVKQLNTEGSAKSDIFFIRFEGLAIAVKIPPEKLTLEEYLLAIRREGEVAQAFSTYVPCVISEIGLPLKLAFPKINKGESELMKEVVGNQRWQRLLKVNGKFAFFMNLLKHPTLADELKSMHEKGENMYGYLSKNSSFFRHLSGAEGFVRDHGEDQYNFFIKLMAAHDYFGTMLKDVIDRHVKSGGKFYDATDLFIKFISGKSLDLLPELTGEVERTINQLEADPYLSQAADQLEELINIYLQRVHFNQRRSAIGCLCGKVLVLLAALHKTRWVHKDFKSSNAFVRKEGGDEYGVPGFIDLETCHPIPTSSSGFSMPCGTPHSATPANYVPTSILAEAYGEEKLTTAFRFMDWHAALALLYKIVAARNLFERSGAFLKNEFTSLLTPERYRGLNIKNFRDINTRYWAEAKAEFTRKVSQDESRLREIQVDVKSPLVLEMFSEFFGNTKYAKAFSPETETINLLALIKLMFARVELFYR